MISVKEECRKLEFLRSCPLGGGNTVVVEVEIGVLEKLDVGSSEGCSARLGATYDGNRNRHRTAISEVTIEGHMMDIVQQM